MRLRLSSPTFLALIAIGCGASNQSAGTNSPPAGPPAFTGLPPGPIGTMGASRLLTQGTFGPTLDTIQSASTQTYSDWFAAQVAAPTSLLLPQVSASTGERLIPWWTYVVNGPDQLRQRATFAMSQILVISSASAALVNYYQAVPAYADLLSQNVFGNFRDLLDLVTHSPAMGQYLTYFQNDKPNPATGSHADENYAREIMQLFTVGLVKLNPDGSVQTDSSGAPIPTYGLPEIENLARVFTGWASNPIPPHMMGDEQAWQYDLDWVNPMAPYQAHHDTDAKTIIGGVTIPAGGTCESDLKIALDTLFNHPNVGPFIGRQLIQRLVTSNPSPAYIKRVSGAFADDGHGVRGNMLAVFEAILTDPEAITPGTASKLREPVLRFTELYRAFNATDAAGDGQIPEQQVVTNSLGNFDEAPYYAPTVFNFYTPSYTRPGPLLMAGLVAPEFAITDEYTTVMIANQLENSSYQYIDSTGTQYAGPDGYQVAIDPTNVMLNTKEWEQFASDPGTLLDNLNLVLMGGQMPASMKTSIVNYVTGIPATSPGQRVAEAAYLVVNSAQYAVQR
jgi:uncharacterized protein (DUF1800 family)